MATSAAPPSPAAPAATDQNSNAYGEIWRRYRLGLRMRSKKERDWYVAKEFFRGNHYNVWIDGRGITEPPFDERARRRQRLIYNKCRISIETILAYLLKQEPTFQVMPNTGEPEDTSAALAARRILYHYYKQLNLEEKIEQVGLWAFITGCGFLKVRWNPLAGPKIPIQQLQETPDTEAFGVQTDPNAPPPVKQELVQTGSIEGGDMEIDVVSPFELVPDPGADTIEAARWVIHGTTVPVDEMKAIYPEVDFAPDNPQGQEGGWAHRSLQRFGGTLAGMGSPTREEVNRLLRLEMWERPKKPGEKGRRVVAWRGGVLEDGPTPDGYDDIPFSMWADRVIPGEFWPDGTLRDTIPLQKELNKRISQLADVANKFKTKWTVMEGSVDESQINDEDGEVIEFRSREPTAHPPPPMPEVPVQMVKMTSEFIDDQTGAIAVLQGRAEGEQRSGRQVAYQGQYGETRLNRLAARMARFLERTGMLMLVMVEQNVTEERAGIITGKSRQMENFYFKGADIAGNNSVEVEVGSLLGFTSSERFDKLVQLHRDKVISDDKFLASLEIADFYPLIEDRAQDRNNALRENEEWRRGQVVREPFYFENHMEHLRVHDSYRKSLEYEQLDPMQRQVVDAHCHKHEEYLSGPPAGAAPPPGPPAPPPGGPGPQLPPQVAAAVKESGQEIAQGLPLVPPVPSTGPEQPPG